jgi:uncharacterized protein (UPF0147 family)
VTHLARLVHDGQGRILVAFTIEELEELALATSSDDIRLRLASAIGLLDDARAENVRAHHRALLEGDPA